MFKNRVSTFAFIGILTCSLTGAMARQAGAEPTVFDTPQSALDAMIAALNTGERDEVKRVFGAKSIEFMSSGDPVEDRSNRLNILELYAQGYRMVPQEDGSLVLAFGADGWPFPVPLARGDDGWAFDLEAGRDELRARVLGLNELEVIDLLDAYVDVQASFRLTDHDDDGVMEFARNIISSESERDGLFWPGPGSLVGELLARASATGYNDGSADRPPEPYSGYYFRILTSQSDAAPGGEMSYIVNGNMVSGHAILAAPAHYGQTGISTFMVSENGRILEADLGEDTLETAAGMVTFDPAEGWTPVVVE